jgi:hypothetical protein
VLRILSKRGDKPRFRGRALPDLLAAKRHLDASRENCIREEFRHGREQQEEAMRGRLFERFEKGVRGCFHEAISVEDDADLSRPPREERI